MNSGPEANLKHLRGATCAPHEVETAFSHPYASWQSILSIQAAAFVRDDGAPKPIFAPAPGRGVSINSLAPRYAARRRRLLGVNGSTFADAQDLRCVLQRLITEPTLLEALTKSSPSVESIEQNAAEVQAIYEGV